MDECERELLAEIRPSSGILHWSPDAGWTCAQIVRHLIRTEQTMLIMWAVAPRLGRWPALLRSMDQLNARLWRAMGMRTIEAGAVGPDTPEAGRFHAPVFLRPGKGAVHSCESLIAWRRRVRQRSLRAISRMDESALHGVRWSHPLLGEYTMLEFARFLGIHERHHLPRLRWLRESHPGA